MIADRPRIRPETLGPDELLATARNLLLRAAELTDDDLADGLVLMDAAWSRLDRTGRTLAELWLADRLREDALLAARRTARRAIVAALEARPSPVALVGVVRLRLDKHGDLAIDTPGHGRYSRRAAYRSAS